MTKKKIDTIPDELRRDFPRRVREGIADGLRCEPADRPRAESGLRKIYTHAHLNSAVPITWVDSPLVGVIVASISRTVIDQLLLNVEKMRDRVSTGAEDEAFSLVGGASGVCTIIATAISNDIASLKQTDASTPLIGHAMRALTKEVALNFLRGSPTTIPRTKQSRVSAFQKMIDSDHEKHAPAQYVEELTRSLCNRNGNIKPSVNAAVAQGVYDTVAKATSAFASLGDSYPRDAKCVEGTAHVRTSVSAYLAALARDQKLNLDTLPPASRQFTDVVNEAFAAGIDAAVFEIVKTALMDTKSWSNAANSPHTRRGGQFWISWPVFVEAIMALGVDHPSFEALRAEAEVCRSAGWYWPNSNFIVVCERPKAIVRDHHGRLHNPEGPSIDYGENFRMYSWRGMTVTREFVEDRLKRTPKDIRAISNAEQRRAAIEMYGHVHGPLAFARDLGARLIAEDVENGQPRRLLEVNGERYVHVVNGSLEPDGTRREFLLGAHPEDDTPAQAVARSYGRPVNRYKEAIRT